MRELRDIAARADALRQRGDAFAVATVVRVDGSAFRREGARMLIEADGRATGAVSGGCLEGEVIEQARAALADGAGRLVSYRLGAEDPMLDAVLGFGSGCDGTVWLLIEPVSSGASGLGPLAATAVLGGRQSGTLATVFAADAPGLVGRRRLALGADVRSELPAELDAAVEAAGAVERATVVRAEGAEVLVEPLRPPVHLAVFGHGPDAVPLVRLAAELGWTTTLAGSRPRSELEERFPQADRHTVLTHPEDVFGRVLVDRQTAAVVLTHVYLQDRALLRELLASDAFYVGALGSRGRAARLRADLADAGLDADAIARLRSPVGLDLGAETPAEIALAVTAEVLAVHRQRSARPMVEAVRPADAACSVVSH